LARGTTGGADLGGGLTEWQTLQLLLNIASPSGVAAIAPDGISTDAIADTMQRDRNVFMIDLLLKRLPIKDNNPCDMIHAIKPASTYMPDSEQKA